MASNLLVINSMRKFIILTIALFAVSVSSYGQRVIGGIPPPQGFTRTETNGFGTYLRNLPLKAEGSMVHLYDGSVKYWQGGAYAVVNMEIGTTDLQQCADACMRLRAEYLWKNQK